MKVPFKIETKPSATKQECHPGQAVPPNPGSRFKLSDFLPARTSSKPWYRSLLPTIPEADIYFDDRPYDEIREDDARQSLLGSRRKARDEARRAFADAVSHFSYLFKSRRSIKLERIQRVSRLLLGASAVVENPSLTVVCRELVRAVIDNVNSLDLDAVLNCFGMLTPHVVEENATRRRWSARKLLTFTQNSWTDMDKTPAMKGFTSLLAFVTFVSGYKLSVTGNMMTGFKCVWEKQTQDIAFKDLGDAILESVQFSIDLYDWLRGAKPLEDFLSTEGCVRRFYSLIAHRQAALIRDWESVGQEPSDYILALEENKEELLKLSKHAHVGLRSSYSRYVRDIDTLIADLNQILKPHDMHCQAFVCIIMGQPGAGKTYFTRLCLMTIQKANEFPWDRQNLALVNEKSQYDDTIHPTTRVVQCDDMHDERSQRVMTTQRRSSCARVLELSNAHPYLCHRAELEAKGRIEASIMLFLGTTMSYNIKSGRFMDLDCLTNVLAFARRVKALPLIYPRPEFADPRFPGRVDEDKAGAHNPADVYLVDLYKLDYNGTTSAGYPSIKFKKLNDHPWSAADFTRWLAAVSKAHYANQKRFLEKAARPGEICDKCGALDLTCGCDPLHTVTNDVALESTRMAKIVDEGADLLGKLKFDYNSYREYVISFDYQAHFARLNRPMRSMRRMMSRTRAPPAPEDRSFAQIMAEMEETREDGSLQDPAQDDESSTGSTPELEERPLNGDDDESVIADFEGLSNRGLSDDEQSLSDLDGDDVVSITSSYCRRLDAHVAAAQGRDEHDPEVEEEALFATAAQFFYPSPEAMMYITQMFSSYYLEAYCRVWSKVFLYFTTPLVWRVLARASVFYSFSVFIGCVVMGFAYEYIFYEPCLWRRFALLAVLVFFYVTVYLTLCYGVVCRYKQTIRAAMLADLPSALRFIASERGVRIGVAAACAFAAFKTAIGFLRRASVNEQAISPSSPEEMNAVLRKTNTWVTTQTELPRTRTSQTTVFKDFVAKLNRSKNMVFVHLPKKVPSMAFFVRTNQLVVPYHWFKQISPSDYHLLKFYSFDFEPVANTYVKTASHDINFVSANVVGDKAVLTLSGSSSRTDFTPFLPTAPFEAPGSDMSVTLITRDAETGAYRFDDGNFTPVRRTPFGERGAPSFGGTVALSKHTSEGYCMGLYVTGRHKGPVTITGLHVAGIRDTKTGVAQTLLREHVTPAAILEPSVQVIEESFTATMDVKDTLHFPGLMATTEECVDTRIMGKEVVDLDEKPHPDCTIFHTNIEPEDGYGTPTPRFAWFCGKNTRQNPRSVVAPTELSPYLEKHGWPREHGPPKFNYWENMRSTWEHAVHPMRYFNALLLMYAVKDYLWKLMIKIREFRGKTEWVERPLTDEEMVNGTGSRYINPLNVKTSAGVGLAGRKDRHLYHTIEEKGRKMWHLPDDIKQDLDEKLAALRRGERVFPVARTALKDEPTLLGKLKVRVFVVLPMYFNLIGRKLLCPILEILQSLTVESEMAVGMNVGSTEWAEMYDHLKCIDGEDVSENTIAGDYSKYDQKQTDQTIGSVGYIFMQIAILIGYLPVDIIAINSWFADIANPYVLWAGAMVMFYGYNMSGNMLTVVINSITNSLLWRMFFYAVLIAEGIEPFVDEHPLFSDVIHMFTYGDDFVATTKDRRFNLRSYQGFLGSFGMKITDERKSAFVSDFSHLHDVSFCKRMFRPVIVNGKQWVHAPLEIASIRKSLHNVMKRGGDVDYRATLLGNLTQALREWARHPREVYEQERAVARAACIDCGIWELVKHHERTYDEWQSHLIIDEEGKTLLFGSDSEGEDVTCDQE